MKGFRQTCASYRLVVLALLLMLSGVSAQAASLYWDGPHSGGVGEGVSDGGSGTWDTTTLNWDQGSGLDRVAWTNANNDTAIFAGTAGTVSLGAGITVGGLQFDTASYIIQSNTLTWGTSGSIIANQDATISSVMAGSVAITKTGPGKLLLTAANTYSGGTIVSNGTLVVSNTSLSTSYTVDSGATLEFTVGTGGNRNMTNATLSGSGNVKKTGAGILRWGEGVATFSLSPGALIDVQGGDFRGGAFGNEVWTDNYSDLNVAAGALFNGQEGNVRVNALTGPGTIRSGWNGSGYQNFTFGVANGSATFNGVLANTTFSNYPGNFVKTGTGTQVLAGVDTYTGTTTIEAGDLRVNGAYTGNGAWTVNSGGILSGTGTINGAVTVNGIVAPGDGGIGKLTVGSVTWVAGPDWPFELGAASSGDLLAINGGFTNGGGTGFAFDLQNTGVAGVYTLVTWTASTTLTNTDFTADNVPAGLTPAFTMNANSLLLELTSSGSGDITAQATNTTIAVVGGQVAFGFNIASGALYHVQASTNLVDPIDNGFTNITSQLTNQQAGMIVYTNTTADLLRTFRVTSP